MTTYKRILTAGAMSLIVFSSFSVMAAEQESKPYVGSEAFERMKQLVGTWEGEMDMRNPTVIEQRQHLCFALE